VERPFSYIRQDLFLARTFRNLDDLNDQLADWLATVANALGRRRSRRSTSRRKVVRHTASSAFSADLYEGGRRGRRRSHR
jgi:hypothetical protein